MPATLFFECLAQLLIPAACCRVVATIILGDISGPAGDKLNDLQFFCRGRRPGIYRPFPTRQQTYSTVRYTLRPHVDVFAAWFDLAQAPLTTVRGLRVVEGLCKQAPSPPARVICWKAPCQPDRKPPPSGRICKTASVWFATATATACPPCAVGCTGSCCLTFTPDYKTAARRRLYIVVPGTV